jgi:hypothetical protein
MRSHEHLDCIGVKDRLMRSVRWCRFQQFSMSATLRTWARWTICSVSLSTQIEIRLL